MADTDRTIPDVIDATTLPADEVERRIAVDVATNGHAFMLKRLPPWPPDSDAVKYARHCGIDMGGNEGAVVLVVVNGSRMRDEDVARVQARFEASARLGGMKHAVVIDRGHKLYGEHVDGIIMDEMHDIVPMDADQAPAFPEYFDKMNGAVRDALGVKWRDLGRDLGPPATQGALTPAKLTPTEARVARKLAGPWHDDRPWQHRKKGVRR